MALKEKALIDLSFNTMFFTDTEICPYLTGRQIPALIGRSAQMIPFRRGG
jgi:hypothetical protein